MRIHRELRAEANRNSGMMPAAAAEASRRVFGNVGAVEEMSQDAWAARSIDAFRQDLRYALRTLRKSPGFATTAVLTLAIGIASTATMFAVMNGVLLRKLPVRDQNRLVVMWIEDRASNFAHFPFSYSALTALRNGRGAFESLGGIDYNGAWSIPAEIGDLTTLLRGGVVSGDFFGTLGVNPLLGRVLRAEDDVVGGAHVLVISHRLWRSSFGGDPNVLGKTLRLGDIGYSIVGVLPQGFDYPQGADFWTTLALIVPEWVQNPAQPSLDLVGRLRPGATPTEGMAEVNTALERLAPQQRRDWQVVQRSLTDVIVGDVRREILVLSAAALLVLILASVNVGGLLLVRGAMRARELAIRSALGAGQARVVRQLLTESLVLALIGGLAGALLAAWAVQVFPAIAPADLPRVNELRVDGAVLTFALVASLVSALVCGLAPARGAARADLTEVLRTGTQPLAAGVLRKSAVIAQISLALIVVAAAGLLTRSLLILSRVEMGFRTQPLLLVRPAIPPGKYSSTEQVKAVVERLVSRTRDLPGVAAVTAVSHLPFSLTGGIEMPYSAEGEEQRAAAGNPLLSYVPARPEYFHTLGLPIRRGRSLTAQDRAGTQLVVVVSEAVARHSWPGQNALGKRIKFGPPESREPWRTVVGVAADSRYSDLLSPRASVYVPDLQPPSADGVWVPTILLIRSRSRPGDLLPSVKSAIGEIDPDIGVLSAATMTAMLTHELARPRFNTTLLNLLAAIALVLAITGLYGVMSTYVTQRTPEIGIRMALGADASNVSRQVVGQGMRLALAGGAIGLGAALVGTRLLASLLFGVSPADPLTLASATLLLMLAALGASYLPARRATRVDPMVALRYE